MNIATILVLIGTVLAVVDFFLHSHVTNQTNDVWYGNRRVLTLGVILIGIGVLLGPEVLLNVSN